MEDRGVSEVVMVEVEKLRNKSLVNSNSVVQI